MTDGSKPKNKRRRRGGGGGGGANGQGGGGQKAKRPNLWRPVPQLADPAPIDESGDATALIRSLGAPPLQGQGTNGEHYLVAAVEKAATLAQGLANAFGLQALPEPDPDLGD
jgi:hypothetical protein